MLGVVLINKPAGITSHDVVYRLRRRFQTKRVGHAGTLDPQATGLLVVAVGPATRFLQYLPLEPKVYEAEITFGAETDTQDGDGTILASRPVPEDLAGAIDRYVGPFTGLIQQIPPMYSAVKKDGQPLYKYARRGEEVERQPRTVHIQRVEIDHIESPKAYIRLTCSGGTYVRTWAHDLGQAIGCGAYLSALRRVQVGKFMIEDAAELDDIQDRDVWPLREALDPAPMLELNPTQAHAVRHGQPIGVRQSFDQPVVLLDPNGVVIGMARPTGNLLQPECVLPQEGADGSV